MSREMEPARIAARYLESLGMTGALGHTMNVKAFAAGRSRAIALLAEWERDERIARLTDDEIEAFVRSRWKHLASDAERVGLLGIADEAMAPLWIGAPYRAWARRKIAEMMGV